MCDSGFRVPVLHSDSNLLTNTRSVRIRVHGIVQGVSFRYYTRQRARALGVTGWVRNAPDGTVDAVAMGPAEAVEALIEWMRSGPSCARVDRLDVTDATEIDPFPSFEIR